MKKGMSVVFCALALIGMLFFAGCGNFMKSPVPEDITITIPKGI